MRLRLFQQPDRRKTAAACCLGVAVALGWLTARVMGSEPADAEPDPAPPISIEALAEEHPTPPASKPKSAEAAKGTTAAKGDAAEKGIPHEKGALVEHGLTGHNEPSQKPEVSAPGKGHGEGATGTAHGSNKTASAAQEVLRSTRGVISNSNLVREAHAGQPQADSFQDLMNLAVAQHAQKDYKSAARTCKNILESKARNELKRAALMQLAVMAQEEGNLARAQQVFAQYLQRFPEDESIPEVLLRQGLIYRQMGAPSLALAKFYAVMTSAISVKSEGVDYYQRLVLHAQTEIAETYFLQGKHEEAAQFYTRLMKLDSADLNKPGIQFKLIRCLVATAQTSAAIAQAQDFLSRYPGAVEEPELRFILSQCLRQVGQVGAATEQALILLQSQSQKATKDRPNWVVWQQRIGNELANRLYESGDYFQALEIYSALVELEQSPGWQMPVLYQIGLVYERLQQPEKAMETYARIAKRASELTGDTRPGMKTILEMAQWRTNYLSWRSRTELGSLTNASASAVLPLTPAQP